MMREVVLGIISLPPFPPASLRHISFSLLLNFSFEGTWMTAWCAVCYTKGRGVTIVLSFRRAGQRLQGSSVKATFFQCNKYSEETRNEKPLYQIYHFR